MNLTDTFTSSTKAVRPPLLGVSGGSTGLRSGWQRPVYPPYNVPSYALSRCRRPNRRDCAGARMPGNPDECRRNALCCAERAGKATDPEVCRRFSHSPRLGIYSPTNSKLSMGIWRRNDPGSVTSRKSGADRSQRPLPRIVAARPLPAATGEADDLRRPPGVCF